MQTSTYQKPLLKTQFIGTSEWQDFSLKAQQSLKCSRIQEIRQQEKEFSKKIAFNQKQQLQQKQEEEEREQKYQEYIRLKRLKEQLEEERLLQEQEIGRAHKEAEEAAQRAIQDQIIRAEKEQIWQANKKIRTQQASEWQKQQKYQTLGKDLEEKERKKSLKDKIEQEEREKAKNYKHKKGDQEEEDPLQYTEYEKNDQKKGYVKNIDFSKTYFHNPIVIKEQDKENAIENAQKEYEKIQKENMEKLLKKKQQKEKDNERHKEALEKNKEKELLGSFIETQKKIKQQEFKNKKVPLKKPSTSLQQELFEKNQVEKAFEKVFFGPNASWTHEEIPPTQQEKQKKNKNKNLEQFEKRIVEKAHQKSKSIKIYRKPPLDSNAFSSTNKNKNDESIEKPQEHAPNTYNQYELKDTIKNNDKLQQQSLQAKSENEQSKRSRKQIKFISPQKEGSGSEKEQEEVQEEEEVKNSTIEKTNRIDIKKYIQEQEEYLKHLEKERQNLQTQSFSQNNTSQKKSRQIVYTTEKIKKANQLLGEFLGKDELNDSLQQQGNFSQQKYSQDKEEFPSSQRNNFNQGHEEEEENEFLENSQSDFTDKIQEHTFSAQKPTPALNLQQQLSPNSELSYSISEMDRSCEKKQFSKQKYELTASFGQGSSQGESLAEAFKKKKAELASKYVEKQPVNNNNQEKKQKTKEELFQLRKEMMKPKKKDDNNQKKQSRQ